ncbi:MAG: LD-carboxypeptidase [Chloroflexi bacterium]|nr:LD-carboxypeptidase [Chloroflexota bacterium]
MTPSPAKPRALGKGAQVAFVAPSRPVTPDSLTLASTIIGEWGLMTTNRHLVHGGRGYLAGETDASRAAKLTEALCDPETDAIWCARGGYGAGRLLPLIDWERARREARPKLITGYSDITALHLAIAHELGWITLHGPVAALLKADGPAITRDILHRAWSQNKPLGVLPVPDGTDGWQGHRHVTRTGTATGRLTGGNLALVASLVGTPWALQGKGKLIVLEDVDEAPYRIDRMLLQLRQAGTFEGCLGIVFGSSPTCETVKDSRPSLTLFEVLDELLGDLGVPVIYGWPIGHTDHQWTLPLGAMATLSVDPDGQRSSLCIDESATADRRHG